MPKIAIIQPYLWPYLGYFQIIDKVDTFVLFDDVSFIKRGWINRNNLLVNNQAHRFSIPVKNASQNRKINEHAFTGEFASFQKLYEQNYRHSKNYPLIRNYLTECINFQSLNVAEFIHNSIELLKPILEIKTDIILSSTLDYSRQATASEKIISICNTLRANEYINPIGGINLYDKKQFNKQGIKLKFLAPELVKYKQQSEGFTPALSILDFVSNAVDPRIRFTYGR
ncbi:hypothetical protein F9L16_06545 [Agarivorans sp. B2Z047]|uniref:WbqC family protein n=1 Tax=Agarivorans sp. B2Z047 TaxID=2652721 RepID=UPI00128BE30D|nr:WbqC family protein [Agarivorans sp. B2Z047]MPW28661.1 hypothetical protein [Agarivorans sp. B2Z047]UQN41222.1 WbqC family protein [Agarivorans sp. B2Z047]